MPNGGFHHCANCKHFNKLLSVCSLRNEKIVLSHWTTCDSMNKYHPVPKGVMKAIVCEVKEGAGSYIEIPYYLGNRADTVQKQSGEDSIVSVIDEDGKELEFLSVEDYYSFYNRLIERPLVLIGALAGDIVGSEYEFDNIKILEFPLFSDESLYTDDSIMTLAVANKLLQNSTYEDELQRLGRRYPKASYGNNFRKWLISDNPKPYNSYGNGSAMRVSPIAYAFDNISDVSNKARKSAEITHNHPEGIKGAQAVASAIFLARNGGTKDEIKNYIIDKFSYNLNRSTNEIRPIYHFDETCQGSVPEAIICFLESNDFENAIRLAISIGGDSDTIASITGALAEAFYKEIDHEIKKTVFEFLPDDLLSILLNFSSATRW